MTLRTIKNPNHSSSINNQFHFLKSENNIELKNQSEVNKFFPNDSLKVLQTRTFDLQDSISSGKRTFLKTFDGQRTNFVAIEVLTLNPYFNQKDLFWNGLTVWYIEDEEVGRNNFNLEVKKEWEIVELVQSWGTPLPGFWKDGECKVEFYLENKLLCKHLFSIGNSPIIDLGSEQIENINPAKTQNIIQTHHNLTSIQPVDEKDSLSTIIEELNHFVGLKNLKNSLSDFITYLNFVQERKKQGVDVIESFSANCIFLGNPGTGKTSIARLLGKFFKSIGLLEHGHVIEVDRSALVGEFIGETAQKTDKIISQSLGGILFIDEAYTLKREKNGKDFGQEAIDIILKRMEDFKGQFFVIAAGYPEPMQNFLESNPGLKSRFTHLFTFDDYSPNELIEIFKQFSTKEKFVITEAAEKTFYEKLEPFCEQVDKNFGNARFIRNIFNEIKIQLSKRYHFLPYEERNFSAMSTIIKEDILAAFNQYQKHNNKFILNEDKFDKYINELNNLVGLEEVKSTFTKLLSAIKVEQLKKERSIASLPKNLNSIFIAEQGAGTSSVARLFGRIFKELLLLDNGQLVEIDSSIFYGLNKIDSFLRLDNIFQDSVGKIVLINDSILTLQTKSDFSDSLLQYFLKKLYIYQDKIVTILLGTRDEIEDLLINVPVIENQFPNIYNFGHYSTRQLLEIALSICQKRNYQLDEGAWQQMLEIIAELRKEKVRNFYNARTIKEILNKAILNQEERIMCIDYPKDNDLMTITLEDFTGLLSNEV